LSTFDEEQEIPVTAIKINAKSFFIV
jgi:hypothetical protein